MAKLEITKADELKHYTTVLPACYVILLFGKEQISRLCIIYSDTKWRL